jgi:hypothetical protein
MVRDGQREYRYKVVSDEEFSDNETQKMLGGAEKSFS